MPQETSLWRNGGRTCHEWGLAWEWDGGAAAPRAGREPGEGLAAQRAGEVPLAAGRSEEFVLACVHLSATSLKWIKSESRSCRLPRVWQSVKMTVNNCLVVLHAQCSPQSHQHWEQPGSCSYLHHLTARWTAWPGQKRLGPRRGSGEERPAMVVWLPGSSLQAGTHYSLYPGALYLLNSRKAWIPVMKIGFITLYSWVLLIFPRVFSSCCLEAYITSSIRKYLMNHCYILWLGRYKV